MERGEGRSKGILGLQYESRTISDSDILGRFTEFNKELTTFFHEYRK
jgi:hypothetical protein